MKTNITRLISITLAVLMVVCSFSACKKKPKDNGDTSTLSTVEVSVDPGSTNYFTIDENSERVVLKENDDGTTWLLSSPRALPLSTSTPMLLPPKAMLLKCLMPTARK